MVRITLLIAALLLSTACATTVVVTKEGFSVPIPFEGCERNSLQLTVNQNPSKIASVKATIKDGQVQFNSLDLDKFDFTQTVDLVLSVVGSEGTDCPFKPGGIWDAKGVKLNAVPGERKTYQVPAGAFKKRP